MSPAENKRAKRRKNKKVRSESKSAIGTEAHPNIPLDFMSSTLESRVIDDVGEAQAAELPSASSHELRCLVCNSEPPEEHLAIGDRGSADGCEEGKENVQASLNIFSQLPWYICSNCKTSKDTTIPTKGFGDYLPLSFVAETSESVDSELCSCKACFDQTCFSELTSKTAGTLACSLGLDISASVSGVPPIPQHLQSNKEEELKGDWQELKQLLHHTYREAGLTLGEALTPHLSSLSQGNTTMPSDQRVREIVSKLCFQDAHKLYLCLESQVKLFVVEMRLRLLMQVGEASSTSASNPCSSGTSKPFVCFLLEEYAKLCSAAARLAPYFEELESTHLKNFKLTWELVNRHLFQSIVYNDPLLHSRRTMNLPPHRVGSSNGNMCSSGHDKYCHDTLYAVTKFDDEMTVLSVLWREAEQLIDDYNQGQAALAKQGLELLHAQMKQMMEEELNLSLFQRYPSHECQKSCSHAGLVKTHCTKSSSTSPNFLSPLELVTLAEQADNHVLSLAAAAAATPSSIPAIPPPRHLGISEGTSASSLGLLAGVWPPTCIKTSPYFSKMPQQAKLFPDITSGFNFLKESYPKPGLDCLSTDSDLAGNLLAPPPPPLPQLSPLTTSHPIGETSGCCLLQHNGREGVKQPASPSKHGVDVSQHQVLQTTKTNSSLKGGGAASPSKVGHPEASSNNSGPDSKGGCECHSCNQQPKRGRDQMTDSHANYEGGLKLRDLSPNLLTGLKSMFAEACGSPSALAAVKQLIHPHLYKVQSNPSSAPNQRNNKTSQPNSSLFPEPFDLKLEAQGILREQIKLAAIGDWDCDADEARSLFLHHYHNTVKNQRTATSPQFDMPSFPQPPTSPLVNTYFPPISLDEVASLRNNDVCQACKVEPEGRTVEEGVTNSNVINNLSQTTRKSKCIHAKGVAMPRELNSLFPDGYGSVDCSLLNGRHLQTSNLPATPPDSSISSASSTPATTPSSVGGSLTACTAAGENSSSSSSLSSMGMADRGGTGHGCCEGHGPDGGDESGPDDSCSEKSSSTSTSNQRESRVCDCCYCEVFGHGVPVVAPVSRNYPEMRDRLRLRLSKRKAEGSGGGGCGMVVGGSSAGITVNCDKNEPLEDSRELDELLKFINGTEEEKNKQRKAKRKGSKKGDQVTREEIFSRNLLTQEAPFVEHKETEHPAKQPMSVHSLNNQKVGSLSSESQSSGTSMVPSIGGRQGVAKSTKQQQNVSSQEKSAPKAVAGKQRVTPHILQVNPSSKKATIIPEKIVNGSLAKVPAHYPVPSIVTDSVHHCKASSRTVDLQPPVSSRSQPDVLPEAEKHGKNQNNAVIGHHHMNGSLTVKEIVSTCSEGKSSSRVKKSKKKKNGGDDGASPDDVFMPKDIDLENGEMDEFEKELEAFKRFCFNSVPLANKEKVHVNLKDIVVKKKASNNSNGVPVSNGHKF